MNRKTTCMLLVTVLSLIAAPAMAYFENTVINPRARAMGQSTVAVPDVAFAPFSNASQLAGLAHGEVTATYVQPFRLNYTDFMYLGAGIPVSPKYGNIGLGISHFKVDLDGTDLLKETQITFGHGLKLYEDYHSRIDFGYALSLYSVEAGMSVTGVDPGSDLAFGIDLGMLMTLHKRTMLAFQVKNLNKPHIGVDNEELHSRLLAGISYQPYDGVVTTFELANDLGYVVQYRGGIEMVVVSGLKLRAGVATGPNILTGGFGYGLKGVAFDYGFSTGGGTLDTTHQFGLRFAWGGEAQ